MILGIIASSISKEPVTFEFDALTAIASSAALEVSKPSDGSGDFTVIRGSLKTIVNESDIVKTIGGINKVLYSEDFSGTTVGFCTTSADTTTSPDGTVNASSIVEDSTTNQHYMHPALISSTASEAYTFSAYYKTNGRNIKMRSIGTSWSNHFSASFNLTTGSFISESEEASGDGVLLGYSITSIGSGWWRCSITGTVSDTGIRPTSFLIDGTNSDNYLGGGTDGVYVFGYGLEPNLLSNYTKTVGTGIEDDDIPSIDWTNDIPELLAEPQSTNLVLSSEDFTVSGWGGINRTITGNDGISPDGENNASSYVATSDDPYLVVDVATTELIVTASIWMKGVGSSIGKQASIWAARDSYVEVKSTNHVLTDQWVRVETSGTFSAAPSLVKFRVNCPSAAEAEAGDETLIWGAQLEALPYATSYIPTNGSTVTRLADKITEGGNADVIDSTEGAMIIECQFSPYIDDDRFIGIGDDTGDNRVEMYLGNSTTPTLRYNVGGGTMQYKAFTGAVGGTMNKYGVKWTATSIGWWANGSKISEDLTFTSWAADTLDSIHLTASQYKDQNFYGRLKQFKVYSGAVTDAEMNARTT